MKLTGLVLTAEDPGYDSARHGFAARFDYDANKPYAVVYAQSVHDVAEAVTYAERHHLPVRPRCGCHSYEAFSSLVKDGVIIDVSDLDHVSYDRETGQAKVGAGIDMLTLTNTLAEVGVTFPMATGPSVGIAGLVQGGGVGLTSRLWGMTCDNLLDVEIVTAEGEIIHANEHDHSDLFWALRGGGGGNFGICTEFTFQTHPLMLVGVYNISYQWSDFEQIVDIWQKWAPFADWGLTSLISLHVDQTIQIQGQYTAPPQDMPKMHSLLEPVLSGGPVPISVQIMVVPARAGANMTFGVDPLNPTWAISPHDDSEIFKSTSAIATQVFPPEAITMLKTALENCPPLSAPPAQPSMVQLLGGSGKLAVPAKDATAIWWRDALFIVQYDGYWTAPEDGPDTIDWVVKTRQSMLPYAHGAYINYVDTTLGPDWAEQYYGGNLPRLMEIKKKYDPRNFFNFPQSIPLAP